MWSERRQAGSLILDLAVFVMSRKPFQDFESVYGESGSHCAEGSSDHYFVDKKMSRVGFREKS